MSELALEAEPIAVEPVAVEPVEPAEPVAVEPAPYDPTDDPRILEMVQTQAAQIADRQFRAALEAAQAQQQTPAPTQADFFDEEGNFLPNAFAEFLVKRDEQIAARFDKTLAQVTQPIEEQRHQEAIVEGEKQMKDVIADLAVREKVELRNPDVAVARIIANVRNVYFPQVSQTYGLTNRAAEIALEKAFHEEAQYQRSIADPAIEAHVNRNTLLAGKQGEPGLGAGSGVQGQPAEVYKRGELSRKYAQEANAIRNRS